MPGESLQGDKQCSSRLLHLQHAGLAMIGLVNTERNHKCGQLLGLHRWPGASQASEVHLKAILINVWNTLLGFFLPYIQRLSVPKHNPLTRPDVYRHTPHLFSGASSRT